MIRVINRTKYVDFIPVNHTAEELDNTYISSLA